MGWLSKTVLLIITGDYEVPEYTAPPPQPKMPESSPILNLWGMQPEPLSMDDETVLSGPPTETFDFNPTAMIDLEGMADMFKSAPPIETNKQSRWPHIGKAATTAPTVTNPRVGETGDTFGAYRPKPSSETTTDDKPRAAISSTPVQDVTPQPARLERHKRWPVPLAIKVLGVSALVGGSMYLGWPDSNTTTIDVNSASFEDSPTPSATAARSFSTPEPEQTFAEPADTFRPASRNTLKPNRKTVAPETELTEDSEPSSQPTSSSVSTPAIEPTPNDTPTPVPSESQPTFEPTADPTTVPSDDPSPEDPDPEPEETTQKPPDDSEETDDAQDSQPDMADISNQQKANGWQNRRQNEIKNNKADNDRKQIRTNNRTNQNNGRDNNNDRRGFNW